MEPASQAERQGRKQDLRQRQVRAQDVRGLMLRGQPRCQVGGTRNPDLAEVPAGVGRRPSTGPRIGGVVGDHSSLPGTPLRLPLGARALTWPIRSPRGRAGRPHEVGGALVTRPQTPAGGAVPLPPSTQRVGAGLQGGLPGVRWCPRLLSPSRIHGRVSAAWLPAQQSPLPVHLISDGC